MEDKKMNKEDILEKSRQEHMGRPDELEVAAYGKASHVGMFLGGAICIVLVIISRVVLGKADIALAGWMIYVAMYGSNNLVLYKHLKSREKLLPGIIFTVFAVHFMAAFAIAVYEDTVDM